MLRCLWLCSLLFGSLGLGVFDISALMMARTCSSSCEGAGLSSSSILMNIVAEVFCLGFDGSVYVDLCVKTWFASGQSVFYMHVVGV